MKWLKRLLNLHVHYWGNPHPRSIDGRLVQTCYECSKDRIIKAELIPSPLSHSEELGGQNADSVKLNRLHANCCENLVPLVNSGHKRSLPKRA